VDRLRPRRCCRRKQHQQPEVQEVEHGDEEQNDGRLGNAGITRTFPWGQRYNLDWRIDATNVLNRVTYSSVYNLIASPQFGLPSATNQMRKITTNLRLRF